MKFRKKPVVIDAEQFTGSVGSALNIIEWMGKGRWRWDSPSEPNSRAHMIIPTLEGEMKASPGDWIIRGVKGEFYPCKPDIFEQTYDLVDPVVVTREEQSALLKED